MLEGELLRNLVALAVVRVKLLHGLGGSSLHGREVFGEKGDLLDQPPPHDRVVGIQTKPQRYSK